MSSSIFAAFALLLAAPQAPDPLDGLTPAARKRIEELSRELKAVDEEYAQKLLACRGMLAAMPTPKETTAQDQRTSFELAVRGGLYHLMDSRSFEHVEITDADRQEWLSVGREWAKAADAPARAEMCGTLGHQSLNRVVDIVKGAGDERRTWEKLQAVVVAEHFDEVRQAATCSILLDRTEFPTLGVPADQAPVIASTIQIVAYAEGTMSLLKKDDWDTMQTNFRGILHKEKAETLRNMATDCLAIIREQTDIDAMTAPTSR